MVPTIIVLNGENEYLRNLMGGRNVLKVKAPLKFSSRLMATIGYQ